MKLLVILLLTAPLLTPAGPAHASDDAAETAEPAVAYSAAVTQYLNTGTFQKREGEWQVVAWQATRVPDSD